MKHKLHIFFAAMVILLCTTMLHAQEKSTMLPAQTEATVYRTIGTAKNYGYTPIYPYYGYTYSQNIYTAAQVNTSAGKITHIAWDYKRSSGLSVSNQWEVYIGHTSKSYYTSTNNWISAYSLTKVYDNYVTVPGSSGWLTVNISDWDYNGTSNIVIAVREKRSGYNSSSDYFYQTNTSIYASIYYYSDGTNPNPYSPPTARAIKSQRANVKLTIVETPDPDPLINIVQESYNAASSISAVDMDDDGDMDMLGTARSNHDITWWENDGTAEPDFTEHTIDGSFLYASDSYAVDMDGDGDMDVIGAAEGDNSVIAWWENNGSQSFTKHIIFRGNDGPDYTFQGAKKVDAADIDGDGDIDVAAIADTDGGGSIGDVRWWKNDGSMNFTMYDIASTMYGAGDIRIKDINGDNHPDLVMATWYGNSLVWFENDENEDDGFKSPAGIKYNYSAARSAFPIDMDNDGDMDVVGSAYSDSDLLWIANSNAGANWTDNTIYNAGAGKYDAHPADLDGDGDVDVLTSSYSSGKRLTRYLNDGDGTFTENIRVTQESGDIVNPYDCSVADMDGDGDMDYLVADYNKNIMLWYRNNTTTIDAVTFVDGSSTGEEFTQSITNSTINQAVGRFKLTAATETVSLASAQIKLYGVRSGLSNFKLWQSSNNSFDSGSDIQLATAVEFDPGNGKTIEFNDFVSPILTGGTYYFLTADAGTFTGDINAAIINTNKLVLSGATHSTTIDNNYLANSAGVFVKHSIQTSYTDASSIYSIDLDQDGDMDMLGTSETLDDITWWENDGNESFTEHTIDGSFDGANDVYAADIDGDGDLDVIGSASGTGEISWFDNDGSESFTERSISAAYANANSIYAGDLDGDGDMDVAATSTDNSGTVVWFKNDGASPPVWSTHQTGTGYTGASEIYITDINKDSKLDILFKTDGNITWKRNNDTDAFATGVAILAASQNPNSTFAIDVDNDGYMDVLSISTDNDDVRWHHENTPTNTPWTEATIDATYTDGLDIYATDIDGDGTVDILTSQGSGAANDLSWFSNNGSETFTQNDLASTFDNAKSVFAVDVDKDGDMDILAASYDGNEIAWWEKTGAPTPTVTFVDGGTDGGNFTQAISAGNSTLARFKLTASTGTVGLLCAQIKLNGSRSGLTNFKLWQSSDDSWAVSDILLGSGIAHDPGNGESIKFNDFVSPVSTSGVYYFLTADASSFSGNILPIMVDATKLGLSGATHSTFIDGNYLSNNTDGIFAKRSLVTDYGAASSVFSIDLDQDGDMDVITTSETENDVDWWENDGSENFTKHTINSSTIYTVKDACAGDIDGDGDIDVLTASTHTTGEITWWENDGSETFTKRSISTAYDDANSICAADIDGDGDIDVVATSSDGSTNGTIVWFESSGASPPVWTTHDIFTSGYNGAGSAYITDIDADSKLDIIIKANVNIYWFKNNLSSAWSSGVAIMSFGQAANAAYAIDVNNNGTMDVIGTLPTDDDVTWYYTGTPTSGGWTEDDINAAYTDGLDIYPTDIDGDGDVDVLTSQENGTFDISYFDNDGSESFTETEVADNFTAPRSIYSVDIDGDGDMDILAAAFTDDEIAWWEQLGTPDATVAFTDGSGYTQPTITNGINKPIGRFQLAASADVVGLLSAEISLYGTRSGLSNFKLWQSADANFGSDIQISSGVEYDPGNGNTIKFKDFVSPVASSGGTYYFVSADASSFSGDILCKMISTSSLALSGATHSSTISYAALSNNTIDYDYLDAVTTNVTEIVTTASMATAASVTIDVGPNTTDVEYVMVAASFNFKNVTDLYAQREVYFKLTGPGSQTGPTLARNVSANTIGAESCGIGTAVYIFDVSSLTGNQTFLLQQQHSADKAVTTTASITAVSLSTKQNHYDLNHDFQSITTAITTTSATFESVQGLQTNAITMPLAGDIFVMASINSASSATAVAQYQLESSNDDGDTWSALGRPMRRSLSSSADNGIVSLVGVLEDQPTTGNYKFRVAARKVSGGDIYTKNSTIVALALAHSGGYFPTIYKADIDGATTTSTSFVNATSTSPFNVEPARGGSGPNLFVASQYLMEASNLDESDQALQAGEQVELTGASTITTPEYNRCVLGNANKGSGGYIGLMTGLTGSGTYSIALDQKVADVIGGTQAGDEALTTSEIILAGFQTFDRLPTAAVRPYGSGTSGDPYQIQILANLLWMTENPAEMASGKYYIQTADIDAYETNGWNSGAGFVGITGSSTGFQGSYDGQNYTISGLTINRPTVDQIGLFKKIDGATIANIGLINVDITGQGNVGGLFGAQVNGSCTVDNCYVTGEVEGTGANIGGISGSGNVTITKSYSEVNVSGTYNVGGFVGSASNTITNCYSRGKVTYSYEQDASHTSGGFAGYINGTATNCYAVDSVIADGVTQLYNVGFAGGYLNGASNGSSNCFFDSDTTNQASDVKATAKTTTEMQTQSTFTDASWDFATIWNIYSAVNDGYPYIGGTVAATWSGVTSTAWGTADNWKDTDVVPTSTKNIIIPNNATNDPVISGTTLRECNNITIESGATLVIEDDAKLTVSGDMVNNGTLTINSTSESASGSLIVEGTSTGNVTYNRWMDSGSWHIVSAPVKMQNIHGVLTDDSGTNDIAYKDHASVDTFAVTHYVEATNSWGNYYLTGESGDFASGKGYLMRRATNGTVSFTGTVADADFTVSIDSTDHAWNALGNPFTSALNANNTADTDDNLISVNVANNSLDGSFAALYIWNEAADYEGDRDDYDLINHASDDLTQDYIQAGQGFIVKAYDHGVNFSFTRAMQSHQTTIDFKSVEIDDWADINIIATNSNSKISTKTRLKFNSQMTNGLDVGYDAGILKNSSGFNLFTQLAEDNGVEFMLQCLPAKNLETLEIPIGLDVTADGEFSFSIGKNNFTETMIPVLNDKLLETKFPFISDDDVYTTTIDDNTKGFGRFSLTFANTTDAKYLAIDKQHFKAWFSNGKINLYGETTGREIVRVYTISGQEISNVRLENINLNTIELPVRISGIYLIRIEKQNGTEVLKVPVIFN